MAFLFEKKRIYLVSRVHAFDYSSKQNAVIACKEIINCFSQLASLLESVTWIDRKMNFS